MHGQFVWYELTTPDVDAATTFYPRFTGWGTQAFDRDYMMWTIGGVPFAGIYRLTDDMRAQGIPPNWMPYVESDDVAATARKAASLGGRVIHGPRDIPAAGRYAVLQDPQGAVFGIYKSIRPSSAWDGTPVPGRFSWHELMATDHTTAFQFYRQLFGWEKLNEMDMGDGLMYLLFGKGGAMYGGMFTRAGDMSAMHPFWLCYINVKDVPKAVATATKAGAMVHRPPMDIPGGVIAILGDPQGAGFALHHVNAEIASGTATARATPRKTAAKQGTAKKTNVKQANAKKANVKKANVKKANVKKAVAKKANAKKANAKQATRKTAGRKGGGAQTTARKAAKKAARSTSRAAKGRTSSRAASRSRGRASTATRGRRSARSASSARRATKARARKR